MTSSSSPCAACKFLQCNCTEGCVFAPYFPADQPRFSNVFLVFGVSSVAMMLNMVSPEHRKDMANSLAYQASMRLIDPVNGCFGEIFALQEEIRQNLESLEQLRRITDFLTGVLAAVRALVDDDAAVSLGHVFTLPHHPQQQQQEDYNYLAPASSAQSQMLIANHPTTAANHPQQHATIHNSVEPSTTACSDSDEPTATTLSSSSSSSSGQLFYWKKGERGLPEQK